MAEISNSRRRTDRREGRLLRSLPAYDRVSPYVQRRRSESVCTLSDTLEGVLEALELEEGEITLEDCGSVPVTVAIDNKSGLVTRCTMDLTELMQGLMPKLMDAAMAETAEQLGLENVDLSLLGFALDIGRVSVTAELYDFDAAAPVEIPAEALAAPEG